MVLAAEWCNSYIYRPKLSDGGIGAENQATRGLKIPRRINLNDELNIWWLSLWLVNVESLEMGQLLIFNKQKEGKRLEAVT